MDILVKSFARLRCANNIISSSLLHKTCQTPLSSRCSRSITQKTCFHRTLNSSTTILKPKGAHNICGFKQKLSIFSAYDATRFSLQSYNLQPVISSFSPWTYVSQRNVTVISENRGKRKSVRMVLQRFRRLGNGLWIRRQSKYKKRLWIKYLKKRGPSLVYKHRKHLICNKSQSKLLDKMVTDYWKKQKWYVEDLYKGYTEETHFYYHPLELSWNSRKTPEDYNKYAVRRYKRSNHLRFLRKRAHNEVIHSHRQKPIPPAHSGFMFAG